VTLQRLLDWPADHAREVALAFDPVRGVPLVPRGLWRAIAPTWREPAQNRNGNYYGGGGGGSGWEDAFCTSCSLPFGCGVGQLVNSGAEFASPLHFNPGLATACFRRALMCPGAPDPQHQGLSFSASVRLNHT